jgi:hypothetical protein
VTDNSDNTKPVTGGEQPPAPQDGGGRKRPHPLIVFVIGFAISLVVGWVFQQITNPETLAGAKAAQDSWRVAVETSQPFAVVSQYWDDVQMIWNGAPPDPDSYSLSNSGGGGIATPAVALAITGTRLFEAGGMWALINLALAALAIAVYNYRRTKGLSIFFDDYVGNILAGPFLLIGVSSVIALVLQIVMGAALAVLGWMTDLAAVAAGATGIAGFCWYCFTELGKKGVEHAVTPKFKV